MTEPSELKAEIGRIEMQARGADGEGVLAALEQAVALQGSYEAWRAAVRELVERALLAGVNPQALYDKPYTAAHVRMIYKQLREDGADLPELKLGAPRRRRTSL